MTIPAKVVMDTMDACDLQAAKLAITGDLKAAERMYAIGTNLYLKALKQIPNFQQEMDKRYGKIELINLHKLQSAPCAHKEEN